MCALPCPQYVAAGTGPGFNALSMLITDYDTGIVSKALAQAAAFAPARPRRARSRVQGSAAELRAVRPQHVLQPWLPTAMPAGRDTAALNKQGMPPLLQAPAAVPLPLAGLRFPARLGRKQDTATMSRVHHVRPQHADPSMQSNAPALAQSRPATMYRL